MRGLHPRRQTPHPSRTRLARVADAKHRRVVQGRRLKAAYATLSHKGRGEGKSAPSRQRSTLITSHPLQHLLDVSDRGFRLDAMAEIEDQPAFGVIRQHVI